MRFQKRVLILDGKSDFILISLLKKSNKRCHHHLRHRWIFCTSMAFFANIKKATTYINLKIVSVIEKCLLNPLKRTVLKLKKYFRSYLMLKSLKIIPLKKVIETKTKHRNLIFFSCVSSITVSNPTTI